MKLEMRRTLAREGYEQKIRKVGQLICLAKTFPRRMTVRPRQTSGRGPRNGAG